MDLLALRTEVLAHGFDASAYGSRVNQYLNDAQALVARRCDYYVDESSEVLQTAAGVATFPFPANFARMRSLADTDRDMELQYVDLRDIDRSVPVTGAPSYYAIDGQNIHLYPIPEGVHNLLFRYWLMPAALVADTDVPTIPLDWHRMLWEYATAQCFWSDDDAQMGQAWDQKFATTLAMFEADQKFPSDQGPNQARSMWERERTLAPSGWGFFDGGLW